MSTEQFIVRMPPGMRSWIAETAKKDDRSMNNLIVSILRRAMNAQKETPQPVQTAEASI
ncbi:MAG TPA: Arc family DNA-binding protein [Gallionella sp.]|nr:Arc family DNA-binding protein [Gallionella sp.]